MRRPLASLPELDSVSAQAPSFSPRASGTRYVCFWASVPNMAMWAEHRPLCAATDSATAGVHARKLFDADAVVHGRHAGAAVLLGPLDAQQAESGELRNQLGRKMLRLVPLPDVRANLRFGELANRAPEQLLLFSQPEIHIPYDGRKAVKNR